MVPLVPDFRLETLPARPHADAFRHTSTDGDGNCSADANVIADSHTDANCRADGKSNSDTTTDPDSNDSGDAEPDADRADNANSNAACDTNCIAFANAFADPASGHSRPARGRRVPDSAAATGDPRRAVLPRRRDGSA